MYKEITQPIGSYPQEDYYGSVVGLDNEDIYYDENYPDEYEASVPDYDYEFGFDGDFYH